ncbi:MAG: hypothetical protein J6Y91_01420 [Alphaproteobacteria bacterium]|nr:hypothetical protein [Alphaproteobacteria bacterium]
MKRYLFGIALVAGIMLAGEAQADIFDSLAGKAGVIGQGLQSSGFIIAGVGLIVFTFMAIFNKIQWKTLAYIMFSTALLSAMIAVIGWASGGKSRSATGSLKFDQGYVATSDNGVDGDVTENTVSRESS